MRLSMLSALLLLAGCAATPAGAPTGPQTTRISDVSGTSEVTLEASDWASGATVEHALPDLWRALPAAFDSLGLEVTVLEPAAHRIGTQNQRAIGRLAGTRLSRYLDCGTSPGGANADSHEVRLSVLTELAPGRTAGTTKVSTTVQANARPMGNAGNWVRCGSRGGLEMLIPQIAGRQLAVR